MLKPTKAIFRPCRWAAFAACCIREISEAKEAIIIRPGASLKTSSKAGSIIFSDGVHPGLSALVESAMRAKTPRLENSASLAKSVGQPSTGVGSNL